MKSKIVKALFYPVALTLALVAGGCAGPQHVTQEQASSHNLKDGPLDPSDYRGISFELSKLITHTNVMYNSSVEALYMAKNGNCRRAGIILDDSLSAKPRVNQEDILLYGHESPAVINRLTSDLIQVKRAAKRNLDGVANLCL